MHGNGIFIIMISSCQISQIIVSVKFDFVIFVFPDHHFSHIYSILAV